MISSPSASAHRGSARPLGRLLGPAPTMPGCPPTRSSGPLLSPTSSGRRGPRSSRSRPSRRGTAGARAGGGDGAPARARAAPTTDDAGGGRARRDAAGAGPDRGVRGPYQAAVPPARPQSMSFAFDLWAYKDVKAHAADIAQRLRKARCPAMEPGPRPGPRSSGAGSTPACSHEPRRGPATGPGSALSQEVPWTAEG